MCDPVLATRRQDVELFGITFVRFEVRLQRDREGRNTASPSHKFLSMARSPLTLPERSRALHGISMMVPHKLRDAFAMGSWEIALSKGRGGGGGGKRGGERGGGVCKLFHRVYDQLFRVNFPRSVFTWCVKRYFFTRRRSIFMREMEICATNAASAVADAMACAMPGSMRVPKNIGLGYRRFLAA